MNDLNKWKEGAELLASLPKKANCSIFNCKVIQSKILNSGKISIVEKSVFKDFNGVSYFGPCLRVDDFASLDSRKFLKNCGFGFGSFLRQLSPMDELGMRLGSFVMIQCKDSLPTELEYFLTIVEIAKKAWIENLPEWKEIWFNGFEEDK